MKIRFLPVGLDQLKRLSENPASNPSSDSSALAQVGSRVFPVVLGTLVTNMNTRTLALAAFILGGLAAVAGCGSDSTSPAEGSGGSDTATGGGAVTPAGTGGSSVAATGGTSTAAGGTSTAATGGTPGSGGTSASTGGTTTATGGTTTTTATGILIDDICRLACTDASTDADAAGVTDGWGFEAGQSCVVPGGVADTGVACDDPVEPTGPENPSTPGSGTLVGTTCTLVCMDASTDADASGVTDGWGWERGQSCVVSGSAADTATPCELTLPTSTPGGTVLVGTTCTPVCMDDSTDADEAGVTDGWGYENEASCVVPGGPADTGTPCP